MLDDRQCLVDFGAFIKAGREKQHMYQCQVAEAIGISQQYYSKIENGIRNVDLVIAMKICQALNLDISDFIQSHRE